MIHESKSIYETIQIPKIKDLSIPYEIKVNMFTNRAGSVHSSLSWFHFSSSPPYLHGM